MQIYLVGGAVRDALMGLPVVDRDWVVVGSTPAEMQAQGFKPVGKDFPVFLHPVTHEEFALARTERKTSPGYRGFAVHAAADVTLEEDLARRDVTINSIAAYAHNSRPEGLKSIDFTPFKVASAPLIDPFGGQADLHNKVLRHVTEAFREDPVRILRLARFNARFPDFSVAPETLSLMRDMVASGEVNALVPERVWQELTKGLMADKPSKMMAVLSECGALPHVLPALRPGADGHFLVLDQAARAGASLAVRFACLMSHFDADTAFFRRVPRQCSELVRFLERERSHLVHLSSNANASPDAQELVRMFERCDAFRKPARFDELSQCVELLHQMDTRRLNGALQAALAVTSGQALTALAADDPIGKGPSGPQIAEVMRLARIRAVSHFLAANPQAGQTTAITCPHLP